MNLISIAGRLGQEAVLKTLPSGKEVVNFAVAVDIGRGENKTTLWVDCSLWGERAAKLGPFLTKGKQVAVSGDFNLRVYDKKDGTPGASITCDVQRLTLMGGGERSEQQQEIPAVKAPPMKPSAWASEQKPKRPPPPSESDFGESEIPF